MKIMIETSTGCGCKFEIETCDLDLADYMDMECECGVRHDLHEDMNGNLVILETTD